MKMFTIVAAAGLIIAYALQPSFGVTANDQISDKSLTAARDDNTYYTKVSAEYVIFPKLSDDIVITIEARPEMTAGSYYYQYNRAYKVTCKASNNDLYTLRYIYYDDHTPVYPSDELTVGMVGQLVIDDLQADRMGITREQLEQQGFVIVDDPIGPEFNPEGVVRWVATINFRKAVGVGKRF